MPIKKALVLSGGGAKGAFTVGALKYLMVELGMRFDLVIGTSTGALIAPLVAIQDIANLIHFYENVEQQDILMDRPDLLAFLFADALNDSKPLERLIERFFGDEKRYQRLLQSQTEVFVTVVNMQTGKVEYGNPREDPKPVFLKKILASASVPVMMPPVKIGSSQYIDGGVKEIAPLSKAIEEGATHILSIILSPEAQYREPVEKEYKSSIEILKRTLELLTDEIVDNDLKVATLYTEAIHYIEKIKKRMKKRLGLTSAEMRRFFDGIKNPFRGKRVIHLTTIRPEEELTVSSLEFHPDKMREMVDKGYRRAKEVISQSVIPC